jgi:hypothetical protein
MGEVRLTCKLLKLPVLLRLDRQLVFHRNKNRHMAVFDSIDYEYHSLIFWTKKFLLS